MGHRRSRVAASFLHRKPNPLRPLLLLLLFGSFLLVVNVDVVEGRKSAHYKTTVAEEDPKVVVASSPPSGKAKSSKATSSRGAPPAPVPSSPAADFSIEDVDEEQIDEFLKDATRNLVIFFYDGRVRCPECGEALAEVEEVDDEIESTGLIEVVKTDDRRVARECGVTTFPALVYFRRRNPILYDGEFRDSAQIWRWIRAHDEVVAWELNDDNFEWRTASHQPDEGALDWLVMFYDSEDPDCNAFGPLFETAAHKLRGLVNAGKVDRSVSDDVTERFRVDADSQCPTFLLLHRGKMYRYNDVAKDVRGLTQFALHKFKDQRGHRVPEPPTALEHLYESVKERVSAAMEDTQTLTVVGICAALGLLTLAIVIKAYRLKKATAAAQQQQQTANGSKKSK